MRRSELTELHYITPIANVPSIMRLGILSKKGAQRLDPASVAMEEIQRIRAAKAVPGGLPLHDYANLYFSARNPMMYKRASRHAELCVLRVRPSVLDLPSVVIADGNAASKYTAFWPATEGLSKIDSDLVFAEDWRDDNQILKWQKTAAKCAEALIPRRVPPDFIAGAYASCRESQAVLIEGGFSLPVMVDPHMFFRG